MGEDSSYKWPCALIWSWHLDRIFLVACALSLSSKYRGWAPWDSRPPWAKEKGIPIVSAFGYPSQMNFRVQLMSRHHARKRYMSLDLEGYVLWSWNHKPEHLMCISYTMREGGLLMEMSHAAAFSAWLSLRTLPPLPLHPTLFLHESHLGLFSSYPACCETGWKCISVTSVWFMADWCTWWSVGVTGSAMFGSGKNLP